MFFPTPENVWVVAVIIRYKAEVSKYEVSIQGFFSLAIPYLEKVSRQKLEQKKSRCA